MYSCGSLAPKMGRRGGGGCSDSKFQKPAEPWEFADGCVHLHAELTAVEAYGQQLARLLVQVSAMNRADRKCQLRQCLGFRASDS